MKLLDILTEDIGRERVEAKVRITYSDEVSVMEVADILRAIDEVTIVNTAGGDPSRNQSIYTLKVLTKKEPLQAFKDVKRHALADPNIRKVEIATKSIHVN